MFGHFIFILVVSNYVIMVKVVINDDEFDFIKQWEAKKAKNDSLHKKSSKTIEKMCVFAKKLVGR